MSELLPEYSGDFVESGGRQHCKKRCLETVEVLQDPCPHHTFNFTVSSCSLLILRMAGLVMRKMRYNIDMQLYWFSHFRQISISTQDILSDHDCVSEILYD